MPDGTAPDIAATLLRRHAMPDRSIRDYDAKHPPHRFRGNERDRFLVRIENGLLYRQGARLHSPRRHLLRVWLPFALSVDGQLFVWGDGSISELHHNSFADDGPLAGAGELLMVDGQIRGLRDSSGHYRPATYITTQTVQWLHALGANLCRTRVSFFRLRKTTTADDVLRRAHHWSCRSA